MKTDNDACPIQMWLAEPMSTDVRQAIQRLARCEDVWHIAVMPDVHLAEMVCVGIAMATTHLIYPDAVGGDIGYGMAAVALDGNAGLLRRETDAMDLLEALRHMVPTNRRSKDDLVPLPDALPPARLSQPHLRTLADHNGRYQFGTLGGGNHFLEFQADDEDRLWLMVHSGSRGIGPGIRQTHLANAARSGPLSSLPAESDEGQAYLNDMAWASEYASGNRQALLDSACQAAGEVLGIAPVDGTLIQCCHNHVRRETHMGRECWVHRKGAMPAGEGEPGIIPGSMGTASFHVEGRGHAPSLGSSSHGAGRRLSRSAARAAISTRELHRQLGEVWFDEAMSHALREEAPKAYRDIRSVMRAQSELVKITRQLAPILCHKGL